MMPAVARMRKWRWRTGGDGTGRAGRVLGKALAETHKACQLRSWAPMTSRKVIRQTTLLSSFSPSSSVSFSHLPRLSSSPPLYRPLPKAFFKSCLSPWSSYCAITVNSLKLPFPRVAAYAILMESNHNYRAFYQYLLPIIASQQSYFFSECFQIRQKVERLQSSLTYRSMPWPAHLTAFFDGCEKAVCKGREESVELHIGYLNNPGEKLDRGGKTTGQDRLTRTDLTIPSNVHTRGKNAKSIWGLKTECRL